jgi:fluoroacetyl-CoA thioesterase
VVCRLLLAAATLPTGLTHGSSSKDCATHHCHIRARPVEIGMMAPMDVGETTTLRFQVGDDDTASALGSGALSVLATPRLLAWCEATTCAVVDPHLEETRTSVGTRVRLDHLAASAIGAEIEVTATIAYVDGRLLRFDVVARQVAADSAEHVVGNGEVTRVVVDRERFLAKL